MTPVEQVTEWLTAIGETTYDRAHRERLLRTALRRVVAAMDEWHERTDIIAGKQFSQLPVEYHQAQLAKATVSLAREICDLAYVAIGTAVLSRHDWIDVYRLTEIEPAGGWQTMVANPDCVSIERNLYRLFPCPFESRPIRRAAAYYGFGDKLPECFTAVHEANMRKLECEACGGTGWTAECPLPECAGDVCEHANAGLDCQQCHGTGRHVRRDAAGRILKPAGWQPADLGAILFGGER